MRDITLTIPNNCELIKEGNSYVIKEKDVRPKSWEEFCENFPIRPGECFIDIDCEVSEYFPITRKRREIEDGALCINRKEAKAFLALMKLRQLRKAWVGDWEQPKSSTIIGVVTYDINSNKLVAEAGNYWIPMPLSFPTEEMAKDFLNCFRDLCETAKILL